MSPRTSARTSPWLFFVLVLLLSVPFWILGPIASQYLKPYLPIDLPISALWFVCPIIVALILRYREQGADGAKELLKRAFDFKRIRRKIWYLPIFGLWPLMMVVGYGLMKLMGVSLPDPQIPILVALAFFVVFFFSGLCEQIGWTGYATDPLQERWGALGASLIVGVVWAIGHVVPFTQTDHAPSWIFWQCLGMVPFRILIVWLYNNTGRSVFATIVFQATSNVSQFLFPVFGSYYDPFLTCLILTFAAAFVVGVWGPETLARNRVAALRGRLSRAGHERAAHR